MIKQLPVFGSSSARYFYNISLDKEIFTLYFHWNSRESAWYMDIKQPDGDTTILAGIKLVPDYRLLKQYKAVEGIPKGDFILKDVQNKPDDEQLTYENFGTRYVLLYYEEGEVI